MEMANLLMFFNHLLFQRYKHHKLNYDHNNARYDV